MSKAALHSRRRVRTLPLCTLANPNTGSFHLGNCRLHIIGMEIDSPACVQDQVCLEAELQGVEGGEHDAIICRQTADEDFRNAFFFQPLAKPRRFAMTVIEETAVAIDARV